MLWKILLSFLIAFSIGALTRWFEIPVPAPPTLLGALLIVAITLGWIAADYYVEEFYLEEPAVQQERSLGDEGDS